MERRALWMSLALHGVILLLMLCDFSFSREYSKPPAVVMQIDLTKVQISNKTNLPQKGISKTKPTKTVPPVVKKETVSNVKKVSTPTVPKKSPVKPIPVPEQKNAVALNAKTEKKQISDVKNNKKIKSQNDLKSLLASVDRVRQNPIKRTQNVPDSSSGINSELEGRLDQMMTISDRDFISSKLRDCWNVDGGTERLDEILVEVKLSVNRDGEILSAKYTNSMNIPAFTQVAESAVRAVYICANKGLDSPFKILAQKYGSHYNDWKEIKLRFSPTEGIY